MIGISVGIAFLQFLWGINAHASTIVQEFQTDFNLTGDIYSSKLAIGDFDGDGRDDVVISDDHGSFHIFALHNEQFVELWISDPLNPPMGGIRWLSVIPGDVREGQIFVLDNSDRLHRFSYDGYVFGETDRWDITLKGIFIDGLVYLEEESENFRFVYLSLLPGQHFNVTALEISGDELIPVLSAGVDAPLVALPGFELIGGLGDVVLMMVLKRDEEFEDDEDMFILQAVNDSGLIIGSVLLSGLQPGEETITEAAVDFQGRMSAIGFSLAEEPGFLNMRIWSETSDGVAEGGEWSRLAAHRDMKTGDIDGDDEIEFIMVGIDGLVRILGEERLRFTLDGESIIPEIPSLIQPSEVYQDASFITRLGVSIVEDADSAVLSRGEMSVEFIAPSDESGNGNGTAEKFLVDPYGRRLFPLGRLCLSLGYGIRLRADIGVVEVVS